MKKALLFLLTLLMTMGLLLPSVSAAPPDSVLPEKAPETITAAAEGGKYASSPTYAYNYSLNTPVTFTFCKSYNLTAGTTVTFETAKAAGYSDIDTVMYLFLTANPTASTSWYNDDATGTYSKISVTVPTTGSYTLMVKGYNDAAGYANVLKDGAVDTAAAVVGGKKITTPLSATGTLNFFTAKLSSGADTRLFVMDSSNRVVGYNDDYSGSGDFSWGRASRIKQSFTTSPSYVVVASYSAGSTGTADVYAKCQNGYTSAYSFPNLLADDSIMSQGTSGIYNCISWAGGITDAWINPDISEGGGYLTPWYNDDNVIALNNYFGNSPARYAGAVTYANTSAASDAAVDVYKDGSSWTHAAVRKPGNGYPHGYDFESKLGANQRIFHERDSLTGGLYGSIVRYYRISGTSKSEAGLTFADSLEMGLTKKLDVSLTKQSAGYLSTRLTELEASGSMSRFDALYNSWRSEIMGDEQMVLSSSSTKYTTVKSFETLSNFLSSLDWKDRCALIMNQYLNDRDVFTQTLLDNIIVAHNADTRAIANAVREKNNEISRASQKAAVYIAPTYEANAVCFINEVLQKLSKIK